MKGLYILLFVQISALLQCDKTNHHATVGSTITITCLYPTNRFRFTKKYWCTGDSRSLCDVLMDTDGFRKASYGKRAQIYDGFSRGLVVSIRDLKLDDTGTYWIAIDKMYADIMERIHVTVTQEAVMKPIIWPLSSMEGTCLGEPVVIRCRANRGSEVRYRWYRAGEPDNILLHRSTDLYIHCSNLTEDIQLFCSAFNDVNIQTSESVTLQLLQPGDKSCVYHVSSQAFSTYHCIRSTTALTSIQTTAISSESIQTESSWRSAIVSESPRQNETMYWSGLCVWYECLRWLLFSAMIISLCIVHIYSKSSKRALAFRGKHSKNI